MAGMFLTGARRSPSFAVGTIMVVGVAMVGSLTVLPAILSKLGDRVEKGRIPLLHRLRAARRRVAHLGRILDRVLRRPRVAPRSRSAVLVTMSIPAFGLKTGVPGTDSLPRNLPVMQTYDRIQAAFPGGPLPAIVAVQADDVTRPQVQAAIADLTSRALATGDCASRSGRRRPGNTLAASRLPLAGNGTNNARRRRSRPCAAICCRRPSARSPAPATRDRHDRPNKDFNDLMAGHVPIVIRFVLAMAFLLLLVTFRSIVIPIKAIVLNLLSVGAAYGVLVFVFQDGHGEKLLGFQSTGTITSWLPLFLFVVLFGLSMDYHVFILSRIREALDRGMPTDEAVAHGIKRRRASSPARRS